MEVLGYKCFNEDMTNRYGKKFEVGKTYISNGEIAYGNDAKYGFHMCKNMEDTLRYFDAKDASVSICLVRGYGNIIERTDDYNGYYDMYSVEKIEILKKLSREEIINYGLNLFSMNAQRFVRGYKLTDDEIDLFKHKYNGDYQTLRYIDYYQLGDSDSFKRIR